MIIDFHTHKFPKAIVGRTIKALSEASHMSPSLDGTGEGLIASMKNAGVDFSVTFSVATKAEQVPKLNEIVIKNAEDKNFIYFGSMHPHYENYKEELFKLKEAGIKGIKVHPVYQDCPLDCPDYRAVFRECARLGLIVISHGGLDIGYPGVEKCGPAKALTVIEDIPDLKLVMAHMGGWKQWDESARLLSGTPVFVDTSFSTGSINPIPGDSYYNKEDLLLLDKERFLKMVDSFGEDKILFGTDSPWCDQKESIDFIRSLALSETQKDKILGENAKNLLNI